MAQRHSSRRRTLQDINRRNLLKRVGVAGASSGIVFGTAKADDERVAVSMKRVNEVIRAEESQVALKAADISESALHKNKTEAFVETIDSDEWIVVPIADGEEFAYNEKEHVAEIEMRPNRIVRGFSDEGGEVKVENLKFGADVTDDAIETLKASSDWDAALENADVVSVNTDEASAHVDRISGVTRVFIAAERADEEEIMLLAEINEEDDLETVYGPDESEVGTQGFGCFANCITITRSCKTPCQVCYSAPAKWTCAPCGACLGAPAVTCAGYCGLSVFW